jgi:hypothetical protein
MKVTTLTLIVAISIGTAMLTGCDSLTPPRQPSAQEQWQHEKESRQTEHEWNDAHDGYSGAFACHTADGGCLHMICATKGSCDYMQTVEKKCAAPTVQDVKVIAKVVVADDACKSVEQVPQTTYITGSGSSILTFGGPNGYATTTVR